MLKTPVLVDGNFELLCRDDEGQPKGDGSVCYVKPESVEMAINVLHEGQLRPGVTIEVTYTSYAYMGNTIVFRLLNFVTR